MNQKYTVSLTEEERKTIHKLLNENMLSISLRKRANILLLSDQSVGTPMKQKEIALRCDVNVATVSRTVCDFSLHGLQQALTFKRTKATNPTIVTGEIEANVIALACSQPPDGFSKWSVRLLTQKVIELQIFETVSRDGPQDFKKTQLKPHLKKQWCIPKKQNSEFVARMEDILNVYRMDYDKEIPLVCMDEQPVQLLDDKILPIPIKPGSVRKEDYEYIRKGSASIFLFTEPLKGWRHVKASEQRTRKDWALQIQELLTVQYKDVKKIRLVMDNLNTHGISSLYETFDPETAFGLAQRLEIHYTPKHGSWLNIAEIELSAMTTQCLDRRIPNIEELQRQISTWETQRNQSQKAVQWQFRTEDARIKLKHLYPVVIESDIN